jgi:hypothetical protein
MARSIAWLAFAASLVFVPTGIAQEALPSRAEVDPSSVVTIPLALPASVSSAARGSEGVEYEIRPGDGFRLLGSAAGRLELAPDELAILPITVSVASDVTAGEHIALTASFHSSSGTDLASVLVDVSENPGLRLSLTSDQADARLGESLVVRFELTNTGNAPDSVNLLIDTELGDVADAPTAVLIGPFETVEGEFSIRPEERSHEGTIKGILMTAEGRSAASHDRIALPVTRGDGLFDQWAKIPTSIFIGTSLFPGDDSRASAPAFGFESAGLVRPGVRLSVRAHNAPREASSFAFRGYQMGPRFLAELSTASFDAAAGQLYSRTSPLAGYALQGAGGRIAIRRGRVEARAHAAVPLDQRGNTVAGQQYAGAVELSTRGGTFGVEAVSEDRGASLFMPARDLRSALLTYRSPGPSPHSLRVDAGWMKLEYSDLDESEAGPAVDARYTYSHGRNIVDVSARSRPTTLVDGNLPPNELRFHASAGLWPSGGLLAGTYLVDSPRTAGLQADRIRGFDGGAYFLDGPDRYEIRLRVKSADGPIPFASRTVEGVASSLLGPGFLDARVEVGEAESSIASGLLLHVNAGFNLRSSRGWGRAGLLYYRDPLTRGEVSLQIAGSYRVAGPAEVYGSVTASLTRFDLWRRTFAEIGLQYDVTPALAVLAAFERAEGAFGSTSSRYSIGIRKGLPLPVPVRQPRSLQGVVFEDKNGNGRYDAGEPLLDGVRLEMGNSLAATRNGRFEFRADVPRGPLVVDPASLGATYLPPTIVPVSGTDLVQVPVHRPASLHVHLFLDVNDNQVRDPTEVPVIEAVVQVRSATGETWEVPVGPDGSVSLAAMRPGSFTVTVDSESMPGRAAVPEPITVTVLGGDSVELELPIGLRKIRFQKSE